MKFQSLTLLIFLLCLAAPSIAKTYYINSETGKDNNSGHSRKAPWKTVGPIRNIQLQAGDSVLFATGQTFVGGLSLLDTKGRLQQPVVIGSYPYKASNSRPILDAGEDFNTLFISNSSFITIIGIEITARVPMKSPAVKKQEMRCGVLIEITRNESFHNIRLHDLKVHTIYYNVPGFQRSAAEVKTANGTQSYGWGIRLINNSNGGKISNVRISKCEVFDVSHTGIKATGATDAINKLEISNCLVYRTGGPGMQFSGVRGGHIHHNKVSYSGSTADSRNWGRGSGLWTWGCNNILIENNRFENANGPGDSAGVHIDFNCSDVVIQYNVSANNAGGFCEILGNNFNCAYRYNISINDGNRVKGVNGAFQEGKIFWLSGYQGNEKKNAGPYNSYFYNNSIYVSAGIEPKIAVSSSADGVLIANNVFYLESAAKSVAGDQKKTEIDNDGIPHVVFVNNLFLRADNWPENAAIVDAAPLFGDPLFKNKGGFKAEDYIPTNRALIEDKGIVIKPILNDTIGLRIGLKVQHDILGNVVRGMPDLGAIEMNKK